MPDLSRKSIAQLRSKWNDLHDLDRALEINTIHHSKVSFNEIARGLGRSPALIRHLLPCLDASAEDQDLARQGKMSTNKLAKRGLAARKRRTAPPPEVVEAPRPQSADEGADLICDWIDTESLNGHHGEVIIKGASDELFRAKWNHHLPPIAKHPPILPEVIIRHTKPKQPSGQGEARFNWYAKWLARWAYFTFEDPVVRDDALTQALKRQDERQRLKPSDRDC
jgi:hypothetical protein